MTLINIGFRRGFFFYTPWNGYEPQKLSLVLRLFSFFHIFETYLGQNGGGGLDRAKRLKAIQLLMYFKSLLNQMIDLNEVRIRLF